MKKLILVPETPKKEPMIFFGTTTTRIDIPNMESRERLNLTYSSNLKMSENEYSRSGSDAYYSIEGNSRSGGDSNRSYGKEGSRTSQKRNPISFSSDEDELLSRDRSKPARIYKVESSSNETSQQDYQVDESRKAWLEQKFSQVSKIESHMNLEVDFGRENLSVLPNINTGVDSFSERRNTFKKDAKTKFMDDLVHVDPLPVERKAQPKPPDSNSKNKSHYFPQESIIYNPKKIKSKFIADDIQDFQIKYKSQRPVSANRPKERATKRLEKTRYNEDVQVSVPTKQKKKQKIISDDDDDDVSLSSDYEQQDNELIESQVLEFLNTCQESDLVEMIKLSKEQAALVVSKRPIKSLDVLYESIDNSLQKALTKYSNIVREFDTVNDVVTKCESVGKQIKDSLSHFQSTQELQAQPTLIDSKFTLKNYQLLGIGWMVMLFDMKYGGILADEMGLGKRYLMLISAQVIGFMAMLKERPKAVKHLIVVPSSTLDNWMREIQQWCPYLTSIAYTGSAPDRRAVQYDLMETDDIDIVVTTYNIATGTSEDRKFLRKLKFDTLILDEGHMIKNESAARSTHLTNFKIPFKMLITGTPVQNNLIELLSLLTFINPELFVPAKESFESIFDIGLTKGNALEDKLAQKRIQRATAILDPFVLRRKKEEVLFDLPPKIQKIEYVDLTPVQKEIYHKLLMSSKKELINYPSNSESTRTSKPTAKPPGLVNVLMQLRKVTNHALLHQHLYTQPILESLARDINKEMEFLDSSYEYIMEDLSFMSDFEIHNLCLKYKRVQKYALSDSEFFNSGKIQYLSKLLPQLKKNGDRILLFSQFVIMLDILEVVLQKMGIKYSRLDGSTQSALRIGLIDEFNNDSSITVFLLSTKACGLGINLTSANVVILYDIDFNPHNDAQAEDRAHRVGQTRAVTVIRLITKNTVEAHMLKCAQVKLLLDKKVQGLDETLNNDNEKEELVLDLLRKDMMLEVD